MRSLHNTKGFTLIELMIVVVIIGILAAIALPKFSGVSRSTKQAEVHSVLKQAFTLQEAYYQRNNQYAGDITTTTASNYLVGWEAPTMKYFGTPAIAGGNGTTFCIGFTNNAANASDLEPRSIDHNRVFYASANCSGSVVNP